MSTFTCPTRVHFYACRDQIARPAAISYTSATPLDVGISKTA
jgi:hypothetical protein